MKSTKAAGRYASSLLDLSIEKGTLEEVKNDMVLVNQTIDQNRDLALMLESPIIKPDAKQRVLSAVFAKNTTKLTVEFLALLTTKGRESILSAVASSFIEQYRAHKGIISAEIVSAVTLSKASQDELVKVLSAAGHSIDLTEKVDPSLLGGIRVKVGDQLIDASLRRKLNELKVDVIKHKLSAI